MTSSISPAQVRHTEQQTGHAANPMSRVIRAAVLGTTVEYYDFGIYGYMATILSFHFFTGDDTAALLGTFAAFAVAFFMRIPGGIFFGHMGDRFGRKRALTWTILLMSAATALMGVMPTYATIGLWATALLVLARCLQGFAAGGELGGANAFVAEHARPARRASYTCATNTGTYLGSLLASLVALGLTSLVPEDTVKDWLWRFAFLISVVIGLIGLYIRNTLKDAPAFEDLEGGAADHAEGLPIKTLLRESGAKVVVIIMLGVMITGGYYIASVYAATYLQTAGGHSAQLAFTSTCIAMIVGVAALLGGGQLADRIGRKPIFIAGSILGVLSGIPAFYLMSNGSALAAILAQTWLFILVSVVNGASFAAYAEMLPTRTRYSGIALANNASNTLFGGTAPFIATFLISATGASISPAFYFILCCGITAIAAFLYKETKGTELPH